MTNTNSNAIKRRPLRKPLTLQELNLPESLANFTRFDNGLVIIYGLTGMGKTTLMSALINVIDQQNDHNQIISFEDPIEYDHGKSGRVTQVKVEEQWPVAIKQNIGSQPFVFLGEIRDNATFDIALKLAETKLVFVSMHAYDAGNAIHRFLLAYPYGELEDARSRLANVLRGSIGQKIIPDAERRKLLPVLECFFAGLVPNQRILEGDLIGIKEDVAKNKDGSFPYSDVN